MWCGYLMGRNVQNNGDNQNRYDVKCFVVHIGDRDAPYF